MYEADSPNAAFLIGRTISGRYTIRATIGFGGMGFVYRATQSPIQREVALKVLRLDLADQEGIAERFTREARAASRIQHPNAITIFEFGEDDGIFYLAMELLSGETLRQRMRREPVLQAEHALDIFEDMAGALAAAHRVGVVHRDLKPDNIFLAQFHGLGEMVKVLDFGLAKLLDREAETEGLFTPAAVRLGTPRYMAPEQALGLQHIDARCDVYALGLLLFEMLANRAPYLGEDGTEVLVQRLRSEAPLLSHTVPEKNFSEALDDLLANMLQRDREHRPSDANELVTRMRELRKSGQIYREAALTDRRDRAVLTRPVPVIQPAGQIYREDSLTDPDPLIQIAKWPRRVHHTWLIGDDSGRLEGTRPLRLAIYSHANPDDEALRQKLSRHLSGLVQQNLIAPWHEGLVEPGADRAATLYAHVEAADAVLVLLSADFLDACAGSEAIGLALQRQQQDGLRLVPVLLRPVYLAGTPFAPLKALPENGKPVSTWPDADQACLDVASSLACLLRALT